MESFKKQVENKYIKNSQTNEEITQDLTPDSIRKIFYPYIEDKEILESISDRDILIFYKQWYEGCKELLGVKNTEVEKPTID